MSQNTNATGTNFDFLKLHAHIYKRSFFSSSLILCFFTCHFLLSHPSNIRVFICPSFNSSSTLPVTHVHSFLLLITLNLVILSITLSFNLHLSLFLSCSYFLVLLTFWIESSNGLHTNYVLKWMLPLNGDGTPQPINGDVMFVILSLDPYQATKWHECNRTFFLEVR